MDDKVYLAFALAMSDQIKDLQKNGMTYYRETTDKETRRTTRMPVGSVYQNAYHNVLNLIAKLKENPDEKLIPYDGQWYTKEEIDKMFYKDIF